MMNEHVHEHFQPILDAVSLAYTLGAATEAELRAALKPSKDHLIQMLKADYLEARAERNQAHEDLRRAMHEIDRLTAALARRA